MSLLLLYPPGVPYLPYTLFPVCAAYNIHHVLYDTMSTLAHLYEYYTKNDGPEKIVLLESVDWNVYGEGAVYALVDRWDAARAMADTAQFKKDDFDVVSLERLQALPLLPPSHVTHLNTLYSLSSIPTAEIRLHFYALSLSPPTSAVAAHFVVEAAKWVAHKIHSALASEGWAKSKEGFHLIARRLIDKEYDLRASSTRHFLSALSDLYRFYALYSVCKYVEQLNNGVTIISLYPKSVLPPQSAREPRRAGRDHSCNRLGPAYLSLRTFLDESDPVPAEVFNDIKCRFRGETFTREGIAGVIAAYPELIRPLYGNFAITHYPANHVAQLLPTLSFHMQTAQPLSDPELHDRLRRAVPNMHELQVLESFLQATKIALSFRLGPDFLPVVEYPGHCSGCSWSSLMTRWPREGEG
ncbi:hypothetical protein DFH09DRAFT_1337124 [Mycena vulgaris]|nr:hypothetical protein DFH09DRAFT_1337124 [Mycena vulgaris]